MTPLSKNVPTRQGCQIPAASSAVEVLTPRLTVHPAHQPSPFPSFPLKPRLVFTSYIVKMSEIEAIVQATHVLSRVSAVNIQDLVPYQTKLEDTLCILQRSLEAIRHQSSQVAGSFASSPLPNTPISSSDPPFPRDCARSSISQQSTSSPDEISNSVSGESENLG